MAAKVNGCDVQDVLNAFHHVTTAAHHHNTNDIVVSINNSHGGSPQGTSSIPESRVVPTDEATDDAKIHFYLALEPSSKHDQGDVRAQSTHTSTNKTRRADDVNTGNDDVQHDGVASHVMMSLVTSDVEEGRAEKMGFLDLIRHPRLRANCFCLWAVW